MRRDGSSGTLISLSVDFDLIRLHDFLNLLSKVAQAHVNTGGLDAGVRGSLDGLLETIELGIECHGERTIDDVSVDVGAEVDLANVVIGEHSWITGVWRVMGSAVIERAASWEGQTGAETIFFDESARTVLELLATSSKDMARVSQVIGKWLKMGAADLPDVDHGHSWFDPRHDVLSGLTMSFSSLTEVFVEI